MAILCFAVAAIAARLARRRFEVVGAAIALVAGIAVIAILQDESERVLDSAFAHWMWLCGVTLLGVGGGFAARNAGPYSPATGEHRRTTHRLAMRTAAAVLLGIATMMPATLAFIGGLYANPGAVLGWLLFLAMLASIAAGGWVIGKCAPRFPIACAIFAVVTPPAIIEVTLQGSRGDFDIVAGVVALLCVPAAVAAYIASSRSVQARLQRRDEAEGHFGDLLRASAFALFGAAFFTGMLTMTQNVCGMHDQLLSHRIEEMGWIESPTDALASFQSIGVRAHLVHHDSRSYRVEIDNPPSVCNRFSGGSIIAQYPGRD